MEVRTVYVSGRIASKLLLGGILAVATLTVFASCNRSEPTEPSGGEGYYVAPNGNDSNPGTENEPWKTIGKAAATLTAGDTVYIKSGTYEERVVPEHGGSANNYIVYRAYQGNTVTIDGTSITLPAGWGGLFDITDLSYIVVSGLRIINAGPDQNNAGILIDNSDHVAVQNCYTYNTVSSGIAVWDGEHITLDSNEVELACNDGEQECITVAGTNMFTIRYNLVHHSGPGSIGGEGIDAKDGSSNGAIHGNVVHHINRLGIYVDSWDKHTRNIQVYQNTVYLCADDGFAVAAEAGGLLENITLYNNIAYDNENAGLTVAGWGEPGYNHPMKEVTIVNNTFYNNGGGSWGGGIVVENPDADSIVVRNNICSQNLQFQILVEDAGADLIVDHNLIDGFMSYPGEIWGSDSVAGDPEFVNPTSADFRLQGNSPAIDKGSSEDAPAEDFDGNMRPQGSGFDIGAFEYGSQS
jgi:hypothetical protein